jgi:hypothetical protein
MNELTKKEITQKSETQRRKTYFKPALEVQGTWGVLTGSGVVICIQGCPPNRLFTDGLSNNPNNR